MRLSFRHILIFIACSIAVFLYSVSTYHIKLTTGTNRDVELAELRLKYKELLDWNSGLRGKLTESGAKKEDRINKDQIIIDRTDKGIQTELEKLKHKYDTLDKLRKNYDSFIKLNTVKKAGDLHVNEAADVNPEEQQEIIEWDNIDVTKALLKQDGLDYNELVKRGIMGGRDAKVMERRNYVKKMMRHAWSGYVKYAWGWNQLKPVSRGHDEGVFGPKPIGATLVDAMDTLFLMEEYGEVLRCKKWLAKNFKTNFMASAVLSVFETTIRFIGGFNTMFTFTGHQFYKDLSIFVADNLVPAFTNSDTRINLGYITIGEQEQEYNPHAFVYVSETGSIQLEWGYLSYITGDMKYHKYTKAVYEDLFSRSTIMKGLYPNMIFVHSAEMNGISTLGGMGDSFYEYILKYWIFTGKDDTIAANSWINTLKGITKYLVKTSMSGNVFVADVGNEDEEDVRNDMDHLACFSGGMFALSSLHMTYHKRESLKLANNLTDTCHLTYELTDTKIGPDRFHFQSSISEGLGLTNTDRRSQMRPEVAESYFIMWRVTKNKKWRSYGWQMVEAMERYFWTPSGYSGIRDVYDRNPRKDDIMQSFFLSETLKYLYLLFSDDSLLPLDKYVFNTEAHPMPILETGSLPKLELLNS